MKIQRFEGKDADEALRLAQAALGPNALVLQTRTRKQSGLLGMSGAGRVEVLAAVDTEVEAPEPPAHMPRGAGSGSAPAADLRDELATLRAELGQLRAYVGCEDRDCRPAADLAARVRRSLPTRTIELRPGRATRVGLIGPTGVGKTTTLAKLAAAAAQGDARRIAFITIDTYRIGAVQQLETYARLLQAPITVAYCPEDVRAAIEKYARFDLVFVDTVGRAAGNSAQIAEQAELLAAADLDETHLCLDAGKSAAALSAVLTGFAPLQPTHVALTKLDEAGALEDVLEAALASQLPASYVTMGQQVPEDLDAADSVTLAAMVEGDRC